MKKCGNCENNIEMWILKNNTSEYVMNRECCKGTKEPCDTIIKLWRDYWTERYELAKLRERVVKYSKGIRDE